MAVVRRTSERMVAGVRRTQADVAGILQRSCGEHTDQRKADLRPRNPTGVGRLFAVASLIEALTWAGLLVGMFLKYIAGTTELGVWLFGRLHGAAFVFYVAATIVAARRLRWPWWSTSLALLAAIPPLVTLPLEMWFERRGFLTDAKLTPEPAREYPDSATTP